MKNIVVIEQPAVEAQSIKNMAIRSIRLLEELKEKKKTNKEMIEEALEENGDYSRSQSAFEDAKKMRDEIKKRLLLTEYIASLKEKQKEIAEEYLEAKDDVSASLVAYQEQTKQLSFFDDMNREVFIKRSATYKRTG